MIMLMICTVDEAGRVWSIGMGETTGEDNTMIMLIICTVDEAGRVWSIGMASV